jgi:hypothetical protein
VRGGSLTNVIGEGFDASSASDVRCLFGDIATNLWTRGVIVNFNLIQCPSPRVPFASIVAVRVTLNGEDYSLESSDYVFYESIKVEFVSGPQDRVYNASWLLPPGRPFGGPITGATPFDVVGEGFRAARALQSKCRFGDVIVDVVFAAFDRVRARFHTLCYLCKPHVQALTPPPSRSAA